MESNYYSKFVTVKKNETKTYTSCSMKTISMTSITFSSQLKVVHNTENGFQLQNDSLTSSNNNNIYCNGSNGLLQSLDALKNIHQTDQVSSVLPIHLQKGLNATIVILSVTQCQLKEKHHN